MVHIEGIDDNMIANNMEPFYLTHPGEVIKDELEFRGISQRRLATQIGVPVSQLNEVLNAKRPLSAEIIRIGSAGRKHAERDSEDCCSFLNRHQILGNFCTFIKLTQIGKSGISCSKGIYL